MSALKQWQGQFGDEYTERNSGDVLIDENSRLFAHLLNYIEGEPWSVFEIGCNRGNNLQAIKRLCPNAFLYGIEPNAKAVEIARKAAKVAHATIQGFGEWREPIPTCALTFTRGVLIHLPPEYLTDAYRILYKWSARYILIAEYYNPTPVEVPYRGNTGMMWKRDFAGELMAMYPDLKLKAYGFWYRNDPNFTLNDDETWFLMEKP